MPNYDGMGPLGQGQMTGRGLGYCILPYTKVPRSEQNIPYNFAQVPPGYGYGRGYGRGLGYGRGYGRGLGYGRGYGIGLGYSRKRP